VEGLVDTRDLLDRAEAQQHLLRLFLCQRLVLALDRFALGSVLALLLGVLLVAERELLVEVFHAEDLVLLVAADDVHVAVLELDHALRDEVDFVSDAIDLVHVNVSLEFHVLLNQWENVNVDFGEQGKLLDEGRENLLLEFVLGLPADVRLEFLTGHLLFLEFGRVDALSDEFDGLV